MEHTSDYLNKLALKPLFYKDKGNFNFRNASGSGVSVTIAALQKDKQTLTNQINALNDQKNIAIQAKNTLSNIYDRFVTIGKIYDENGIFFDAYNAIVGRENPYLNEAKLINNKEVELVSVWPGSLEKPSPPRIVVSLFEPYKSARMGNNSTWYSEMLTGFSTDWQGCDSTNRNWQSISSCTPLRTYQMGIVFIYLDDLKKQIGLLNSRISDINGEITTKFGTITTIDKQISKLLGEEKEASDQRIKENLTSPEYIKAKQAYDLAMAEAKRKSKRNLYFFVGGVLVVSLVGAIFLIPGGKKNGK